MNVPHPHLTRTAKERAVVVMAQRYGGSRVALREAVIKSDESGLEKAAKAVERQMAALLRLVSARTVD